MNINMQGFRSFGSGGLLAGNCMLKSTQQRMERQETRDRQIAFFENQKENLRNVKCETAEEIARKLELFHSYEDQIKAAKAAYNNEQIWHMMDESQEIGEKIAEAVEKSKPKTAEERKEELVEEVTGAESGGIMEELDEMMEEALELQEEISEELQSVQAQQETEPGEFRDAVEKNLEEVSAEDVRAIGVEKEPEDEIVASEELPLSGMRYRPIDLRA